MCTCQQIEGHSEECEAICQFCGKEATHWIEGAAGDVGVCEEQYQKGEVIKKLTDPT